MSWALYVYVFVVCVYGRSLPLCPTDALPHPPTHAYTQTRERIQEKLLEYVPSRNPEWPLTGHILDPVSTFLRLHLTHTTYRG
jgi:hypothetical protein